MKTLSICIPTYEMKGLGVKFLQESFDILTKQTFKDFDVVVSDHSQNDEIKNLCEQYSEKLDIKYFKNENSRGNSSANLNNAIKHVTGKLIKILFQDDFLYNEKSLEETVKNFDLEKDSWLVSACEHSYGGKTFDRAFYPKYNHKIHLGKNTISSPSVLTIKNNSPIFFDENLIWLMDCDYYRRLYDKFGTPKILNTITVVNRAGNHQITNTLATHSIRTKERKYMIEKFGKNAGMVNLANVTLCAVACTQVRETITALKKSLQNIRYSEAILITHENISLEKEGIKVIQIKKLDYKGYNHFILYRLKDYIKTEFVLVVQNDGYVMRPYKWKNAFLEYDYIGAPWPKGRHFTKEGINVRVGNGGFSFRSRKLLNMPTELGLIFDDNSTGFYHEDGILCVYYRKILEERGIKYAPVEVASLFSRERWCPDSKLRPFGFHNNRKSLLTYAIKKFKKIFK